MPAPRKKPNQIARVLAIFALFAAFALVIVAVAGNGDSDGGDNGTQASGSDSDQTGGPTRKGERAIEEGVWIVEEGDTLTSISEQTGIDVDELVALNPDADPQALSTGERISLRPGQAEAGSSSSDSSSSSGSDATTTTGDPADEFGDGSVANDNSDETSTSP